MNKPTERIVVFVSPAQKRAIAASAERLGISVSELMRRAVLSFGATSEQVKAASIVDRLNAPREPDALNEALLRAARPVAKARGTRAAAAKPVAASKAPDVAPSSAPTEALPFSQALRAQRDALEPNNLDGTPVDHSALDDLQAAARVIAAKAAAIAAGGTAANSPAAADTHNATPPATPARDRRTRDAEERDPPGSPTPDGRFA
ncbi:plasmid mobilization protein [Paraburkholderia flava]|uniref:plasmid mobilization protein n=1 Tax=Paraburkholderia flava TaxID=2547393 RepID=UPI00105DADB6|nr:hypothetical protein [Paraburkholderia flava]